MSVARELATTASGWAKALMNFLRNMIELLPVETEHIYALAALPDHHRDRFDRLLVAQARYAGLRLISTDPRVSRYPVSVLW